MVRDLLRSVKSFRSAKQAIAARERQLIENLNRVLPEIGYRVVPAGNGPSRMPSRETPTAPAEGATPRSGGRKPLACPQCDRRFARPLHLGRHLSATHSRRQKAA